MRTNNDKFKKNYWVSLPFLNNFFIKVLKKNRHMFYDYFSKSVSAIEKYSVLDVGTTDIVNNYENIFIQKYPFKEKITCLSNQKLILIKNEYPEIKTQVGDGRKMNFNDNCFDVVHSNATLEHVGNHSNQLQLIKECYRVSKKFVFIQTPNRFFPLDFHTKLPLIHFLPGTIHRFLLKILGLSFYSDINNLNLVSKKNLLEFLTKLNIKNFKIVEHKLFGFVSNLILIIRK
tara:strand:+ start:1696 stop:2388 length:693 start_codon:yes stop_codon:yes gene_type:complete